MESIYWVMTWLCHRTCHHCYEQRFKPYHGDDLKKVLSESEGFREIIGNLPERFVYRDGTDVQADGQGRERVGRIILAGGEILLEAVRETLLYPALELLNEKYNGEVKLSIQTTGDLLTPKILGELLERKVWMISVSGVDEHHAGMEDAAARVRQEAKLRAMFERFGVSEMPLVTQPSDYDLPGPLFNIWGAREGTWIGELWPRGRAWENSLNQGSVDSNFCNRWSGGLNFLNFGREGAEVSIEPTGAVYPCCVKTKVPVGNLREESLESILRKHRGNPVYEAINAGTPELMGLEHGWSRETFLEKSKTTLPSGREYQNLCVGCDRFHTEVLMKQALVQLGVA